MIFELILSFNATFEISKLYSIKDNTYVQFFRYSIIDFLIKFKHIIILHLIVLEKENIVCVPLVNTTYVWPVFRKILGGL